MQKYNSPKSTNDYSPAISLLLLLVATSPVSAASKSQQDIPAPFRPLLPAYLDQSSYQCNTTVSSRVKSFYTQNDWGAVYHHRNTLQEYCSHGTEVPSQKIVTSLKCNEGLVFCDSKNIWVKIGRKGEYKRHETDDFLLSNPPAGSLGQCHLASGPPKAKNMMKSLNAWSRELLDFRGDDGEAPPSCDVTFDHTVLIVRGDARSNIYHHMCDFVNMYLSMYVAGLESAALADISILHWEPENLVPFKSNQRRLYSMFTSNPILHMNELFNKTLCFKRAAFAIKPRALFTFFYNQPRPAECVGTNTSFMRAFSDSAISTLLGPSGLFPPVPNQKIHIVFISRKKTGYRHVINEQALTAATMAKFPDVDCVIEHFDLDMSMEAQAALIRKADIIVSMHGAGLTHMLWLREWAAVYEIYDCLEKNYVNLASMLGLFHTTGTLDDFTVVPPIVATANDFERSNFIRRRNIMVDVDVFLSRLSLAIAHVRHHPSFPGLSQVRGEL